MGECMPGDFSEVIQQDKSSICLHFLCKTSILTQTHKDHSAFINVTSPDGTSVVETCLEVSKPIIWGLCP